MTTQSQSHTERTGIIPLKVRRIARTYRNGRTNICLTVPKDVVELLNIEPGEPFYIVATTEDGGWFKAERADEQPGGIGGGGVGGSGKKIQT
jgi:hypothetical protein